MRRSKIGAKNLDRIKILAKIVRRAAFIEIEKGNTGPLFALDESSKRLGGACGDLSQVLLDFIRKYVGKNYAEYENGGYDGQSHCWLRLRNGMTLDITATQFNAALPGVYILKSKKRQKIYEIEGTGECCEPSNCRGEEGYKDWRDAVKRSARKLMVKYAFA